MTGGSERWIRLVWFTRLRWTVPALALMAVAARSWTGLDVPLAPVFTMLAATLTLNGLYVLVLRRWQHDPDAHARGLERLAHVQVLADEAILLAIMHATGGGRTPFWPFLALTVIVSALFFPRRAVVALYAAATVLGFAVICVVDGPGLHAPELLLLAGLLGYLALIAVYFAVRLEELERLRREKATVEEAATRKDEILSIVSHELGNPLSALRGVLYLARNRKSVDVEGALQRIDRQVERMTRLVGDLYDVTSAAHGKLRLELERCDLAQLAREVADRFSVLYPTLTVELDAPDAIWGLWDRERLDQLLTNLLSNAVKYAGERARVQLRVLPASGASTHLAVRDDGPGIPPEKLPIIFEPFQRLGASGQKGLGVGLTLARAIAVLHGGALWAESEPGLGTTFHLRLPTGGAQAPS